MITVPPTAPTLTSETYWIGNGELPEKVKTQAKRYWVEWYRRKGERPCVEDGHIVVEFQRLVELAIFLNIPMIQCRTFHFDNTGEP